MATKLDQSLEEILASDRKSAPRRGRRVTKGTKARTAAPVGGVGKSTKAAKSSSKATAPTGPSAKGESKVIVSNLPQDVGEGQIKDYFNQAIAPVKRVQLTYGPNGQSRGVATVVFYQADSASKALAAMNGVKVDGRSVKIEVVLDAKHAPAPVPVKGLKDRISSAKPTPRSATGKPKAATDATGSRRGRGRGGRTNTRRKPKTTEELDTEMDDYFGNGDQPAATNGTAAAAAGDAGMDEVL